MIFILFKKSISLLMCFVFLFNFFCSTININATELTWSVDWFGTELWRNKENKLQDEDVYYIQYYNSGWFLLGFSIAPVSVQKVSVNSNWDKVTLTFDVPKSGYFCNTYRYDYGEIVYTGRSSTNKTVFEVNCLKDSSYSSEKIVDEDSSFFGRLLQGLKNLWYDTTENTFDFLFKDDTIVDYWNKIGDDWCEFVKTVLDIDDEATLKTVMTDIYNNDFSRDYWTNIDTKKITQIQNTSNNVKRFWENNVTVVSDDDISYHYEIKNYNPTINTYPSYLYDSNYFYEYLVYNIDTNNDDIVYWLKRIYNSLEDFFSNFSVFDFNTTDNDNDEFIKEVKKIIVSKIPFLGQCIEILEPATNVCIDNIDNDIDLIEDSHSVLLTEQYSLNSLSNEEVSTTTYSLYDNFFILQVTPYKSLKLNKISLFGMEFDFELDIDYYYNNYRLKISNILLFLSYLLFAWSIIRRSAKLFGHDADKE